MKAFRALRKETFSKHIKSHNKLQEANFSQKEKETFLKMSLEAVGHDESQSFKLC